MTITTTTTTTTTSTSPNTAPSPSPPQYQIRSAQSSDLPFLAPIEKSAGHLFRTVGLDAIADDKPIPVENLREYLDDGHLWVAVTTNCQGDENPEQGTPGTDGREHEHEHENRDRARPGEEVVGFLAAFPILSSSSSSIPPSCSAHEAADVQGEVQAHIYLHVAELSVHASHQRRGLARRLLAHLVTSAQAQQQARPLRPNQSHPPPPNIQPKVLGLTLTTYATVPFNGPFYESAGFEAVDDPRELATRFGARAKQIWDEEQNSIPVPEGRCWMVRRL